MTHHDSPWPTISYLPRYTDRLLISLSLAATASTSTSSFRPWEESAVLRFPEDRRHKLEVEKSRLFEASERLIVALSTKGKCTSRQRPSHGEITVSHAQWPFRWQHHVGRGSPSRKYCVSLAHPSKHKGDLATPDVGWH